MIQRVQTLFLALIAVCMAGVVAYPIWSKTSADGSQSVSLTALQLAHKQGINSQITPVWYVAILAVLAALVALYAVFQYKNRTKQMLLCGINSIFMTAMTAIIMYFIFAKAKNAFEPDQQGDVGVGFYALIGALVCNFLANRFIRRDENFVRSQDRMR